MEHTYLQFAVICIAGASVILISVFKGIDWLIGLKYLSKDKFAKELEHFSEEITKKFATIESHKYLKEDIDEIKSKLNDIHEVVMTFTVNSFKERHK